MWGVQSFSEEVVFKLRGLKDKFGLASKEESKQLFRQMERHIQGLGLGRRMTHLRTRREASVTKHRALRGDGCIRRLKPCGNWVPAGPAGLCRHRCTFWTLDLIFSGKGSCQRALSSGDNLIILKKQILLVSGWGEKWRRGCGHQLGGHDKRPDER